MRHMPHRFAIIAILLLPSYTLLQAIASRLPIHLPLYQTVAIISLLLGSIAMIYLGPRYSMSHKLLLLLAIIGIVNWVATYTTIFIERSVTYHTLFQLYYQSPMSPQEFESIMTADAHRTHRFNDMHQAGLIKIMPPTSTLTQPMYQLTPKGSHFAKLMLTYGRLVGIHPLVPPSPPPSR